MPPKRKTNKDLPPNLYPATDTRDGVTRYRYRNPRTGKAAAIADAKAKYTRLRAFAPQYNQRVAGSFCREKWYDFNRG